MEFRLLGPVEVVSNGQVLRLGGAKRPALVVALLLHANRAVALGQLTEALWAAPPRAAESNLRTYVVGLRTLLVGAGEDGSRVSTDQRGYRLEVRPGELDLDTFEALAAEGDQALARADTPTAVRRLRAALDLWRGPALAGLVGGPYLGMEADRLDQRRLQVVRRWADAALAERCHEQVATELDPLVRAYPTWEGLWGQLMLALYRCDRRAAALAAYREAYQVLTRELGVLPGQALQELHQRILAADPDLDPPPPDTPVRTALPRPRQPPANLVAPAGRGEQFGTLDSLLDTLDWDRPAKVVITVLTGTSGIGRTTLEVQWAAARPAEPFTGGRSQLSLRGSDLGGAAASPYDAVRGLLDALGVAASQVPVTPDTRPGLYRGVLAGRRISVLLDSTRAAEQIPPARPVHRTGRRR
ncbi:BTAD domain-containing putative transcriptional regulator [Plantactinospora sp. B6F1]|uniref:AfsR/SARP family transcriptional regulator n=1 Tax=Plantactinospora sp. B6F1 TaxID=3158971 RepID=UPI0032D8EF45